MKLFIVSTALCVLTVNIIGANSQWVWNKNLVPDRDNSGNSQNSNNGINFGSSSFSNGNRGDRDRFFVGQSANPPANNREQKYQSRLIPSAISAISNSISSIAGGGGIPGIGGGGGGGALGGGILGALSSFPQLIAGLISGSSRPANPTPAPVGNGGGNGGGGGGGGPSYEGGGERCQCFNNCVVPFLSESGQGTCAGGMKMCCTKGGTRIVFEGSQIQRERPTRDNSVVRQGLFNEILRGSSRIVDDTLDLILQPFLTEEDQQKIAHRLADN